MKLQNNLIEASENENDFENAKKNFLDSYSEKLRSLFNNYNKVSSQNFGKNIRERVYQLEFGQSDFEKEILSLNFSEENKIELFKKIEKQLDEIEYLNKKINEKIPQEYVHVKNEDIEKGILKTNYLFIRINSKRINDLFPSLSEETKSFNFQEANWDTISFALPLSLLHSDVRIIPYINAPINNIPLILKQSISNNTEFQKISESNEMPQWDYESIFKYQITLENIVENISSLKTLQLFQRDKIYEGVHFLNKDEYYKIIELGTRGFVGEKFNKSSISQVFSDSPSADIPDQLDIEGDINALASVIAYKEVQPPIAVGLFGNWGSGKSFFMKKLEKKINDYAESKNDVFCKDVVQITFNSWHYSDSNLWASLITKIFDELNKFKKDDPKAFDTLIKNLGSTKELIAESKLKLSRIKKEQDEIKSKIDLVQNEIDIDSKKLSSLKAVDIIKRIWENKEIKESVTGIEKNLPDTTINNIQTVKTKINELSSFVNQFSESLKIIYKFKKAKFPWAISVAIVAFILSFLIIEYQDKTIDLLNWVSAKSSIYIAALTQLVLFITPAMAKVKSAYKNLKVLESLYTELETNTLKSYNKNLNQLENELKIKNEEINKYKQEEADLKGLERKQKEQIEDIITGKKMQQFIANKAADKRYIDKLGIISWIRKDFEELNFLLKTQNELTDEDLKNMGKTKVEDIFKIDRIILYIDDLDRCNEEIVVRVLEAIHLLLAFPLFVVVVGVDPRWMHSALTLKYKNFLNNHINENDEYNIEMEEPEDEPIPANLTNFNSIYKKATSYDYLEKIFQIPFILKPIDDTGKNKLISSKFDISKKNEQSDMVKNIIPENNNDKQEEKEKNKIHDSKTTKVNNIDAQAQEKTPSKLELSSGKDSDKPKESDFIAQSELLKVSDDEVKFMQNISFLIGETPRTINRYINIYRIIRTHSKFGFVDKNELDHYFAAMLLLAVITGLPENAESFIRKIQEANDSLDFESFIQNFSLNEGKEENQFKLILEKMKHEMSLQNLCDIELEKFKKNLNLISRFRFRAV